MNSAQRIIAKFGGQATLAAAVGRPASTVQYWAKVGIVPAKWHSTVLTAAMERGVELYPGDFIETPDDQSASAGTSVAALPIAQWPGTLTIGALELPVYVLNDGRRVISRTGAVTVLTGSNVGGNLDNYIGVIGLKSYLPDDIREQFIEFVIPEVTNKTVLGMTAETFLEICTAYVRALDDGVLQTDRQREIAIKSGMFLASCAKVGLLALIDEATGYQYVRAEDALQFKLKIYLEEEMRKWETTFPDELWREFGRLTHWRGALSHRPKYWGQLVMQLIYEYLDSDVAEWLRKNNPQPQKGRNHHQWLSSQFGLRKLVEHIWMVIGLAKACQSMPELKTRMAEIYGRQPVQYTLFLPPPTVPIPPARRPVPKSPGNESKDSRVALDI